MIEPVEVDLGDKSVLLPRREPKLSTAKAFGRAIPVCEPDLSGKELEYVTRCVESGWISSIGDLVPEFEQRFASAVGAKHGIACSNGTTALHLALHTLGIGPGDEVIIPSFTMIATANAVRYTGATPVLVDSDRKTWNLSLADVEAKIGARSRAIVPVHTYGNPCNIEAIERLAKKHGLAVIYDAAEAHGAEFRGRPIGNAGAASTYSFYANKIVTTGEGGMVTTDDESYARLARTIRGHAFSEERHFWHRYLGFNYRLTNLQAAVGLAQLERFRQLVESRIAHAMIYNERLSGIPGLSLPPTNPDGKNVYWMYGLLVEDEFGMSRDSLREYLADRGVETRTFFIPIHLQPIYYRRDAADRYPVAEELCRKGLYLPSSSKLTLAEQDYIAECIRAASREGKGRRPA